MSEPVFLRLAALRSVLRRFMLVAAASLSFAVVLVPTAYRVGDGARPVLLVFSAIYLGLGVYRLVGSFQVDRQLDLEERFVRFAATRAHVLEATAEGGSIWRQSAIVQGIRRAATAVVVEHEAPSALRRALHASTRGLIASAVRIAVPVLLLVALAWLYTAVGGLASRSLVVLIAVLPVIAILATAEWLIGRLERSQRREVAGLVSSLAAWADTELSAFRADSHGRTFLHRVVYRDLLPGTAGTKADSVL